MFRPEPTCKIECAKNCQAGLSQWNCHQSNPLHKFELGFGVANNVVTTTTSVRQSFECERQNSRS